MEGFKGTPGRWSFEHNCASDKDIFCINVIADGCSDICYLQSSEEFLPNREQTVANANLIAAAPELLEALIEARVWVQGWNAANESEESYKALVMCNKSIDRALGQ